MVTFGKMQIKQPSLAGRIGERTGQMISEQLPKAMEQGRLAAGLEQFRKNSQNMNPLDAATALFSIPGITPQMVQAIPQLLRQQQERNAYLNRGNVPQGNQPLNLQEAQFGQLPGQIQRTNQVPTNEPLVGATEIGQPQIVPQNPLREEAKPAIPLTESEFLDEVAETAQRFPGEPMEKIFQIVNEKENRRQNRPLGYQAYDNYLKNQRQELKNEFQKELERHLEKTGPETFANIPGNLQSNMERTIERRLISNRNLSMADAVKEGVNQLFEFSRAKSNINSLASKSFYNFLTPGQRDANFSKLKTYSNIYDKLNQNREFYDKLKTHSTPDKSIIGFGMSPQAAASLAYPTDKNKELQGYINSIQSEKIKFQPGLKTTGMGVDSAKRASEYAINVEKYLQDEKVSPLAIAAEIKKKDPYFNQNAFFDQLRRDNEEGTIKLWPSQLGQLGEAESETFPNWGDLWFLPF